jgi:hypothetical protein
MDTMNHSLPWTTRPVEPRRALRARRALAATLQRAAAGLAAAAHRLAAERAPPAPSEVAPWLEFHADAGAPEGALYVNGVRVGTLPGIGRL